MLVDILALIMILLVTGYYASQGLFSATLSLVAAIFASVLAMGLYEPLSGIVGGYRPGYAHGVTFLLLFFLALSACRLATDFAVRKNIKFTKPIDAGAGAVVGFFAAMVIVGSSIIGFEMLPLHTSDLGISMGFDRYPDATGMEGAQPGKPADPQNVWLLPDRFTLAMWDASSGRGFGGQHSFDDVHPDLTVESYGYRNMVSYASNAALPPDLLSVTDAYTTESPKGWAVTDADLKRLNATDAAEVKKNQAANLASLEGKLLVVVRTTVSKGTEPPHSSSDSDGYFRITPSQVRLVTSKDRQYYPVGELVNGRSFERLSLTDGHYVDDYVSDKVVEDWVFAIEHDESPTLIEMKELARVDLTGILKTKAFPALAAADYPKREYLLAKTTVTINLEEKVAGARCYLLPEITRVGNVQKTVQSAYSACGDHLEAINNGPNDWARNQSLPGVPSTGDFRSWVSRVRSQIVDADPEATVGWSEVAPILVVAACTPSATQNIADLPGVFNSQVVKLLTAHNEVRANGSTTNNGTLVMTDIAPGKYVLIVSLGTKDTYEIWTVPVDVKAKTPATVKIDQKSAAFSLNKNAPPP